MEVFVVSLSFNTSSSPSPISSTSSIERKLATEVASFSSTVLALQVILEPCPSSCKFRDCLQVCWPWYRTSKSFGSLSLHCTCLVARQSCEFRRYAAMPLTVLFRCFDLGYLEP
uniref:Uncharacterized protein n=1 Tax=Leersia perrieri TaxID=77586 RepID=A0A0D9XVE5_9ORYZ